MMDDELKRDPQSEPVQAEALQAEDRPTQARVFSRVQPTDEVEDRLAERIVCCRNTLEHIQNQLTKAWRQLRKVQDALKHDPLP